MNPLVVPWTSVKFKSAFLYEQWAVNILGELLFEFDQIENLWMDKIASKTFISIQENWGGRNFITASLACD